MNLSAPNTLIWFLMIVSILFCTPRIPKVIAQSTENSSVQKNDKSHEQVFLTATAFKNKGEYLTDLKADDFDLIVDKQPQPISYFAKGTEPVGIVFAIDQSGSMRIHRAEKSNKACLLPEAVGYFFRSSNGSNEYSILTFNRETVLRLKWTRNTNEVASSFKEIGSESAKLQTALYDSLNLAIEQANGSAYKNRVIIVFSDGDDNVSHLNFAALKRSLLMNNILVYVININSLFRDLGSSSTFLSTEAQRMQTLKYLAEMSGGEVFSPENQKQLNLAFDQISRDLKNQYVIGFKPLPAASNKLHKIKLQIKAQTSNFLQLKNASLRYREGYYEPPVPK